MRISSIEIEELFSFGRFKLDGLDPAFNVIVGPNGAGKSNLVRVLEGVRAAIERVDTASSEAYDDLLRFSETRRMGSSGSSASVARVGVFLNEDWERELMTLFVRGAAASGLLQGVTQDVDVSPVMQWADRTISEQVLAPLFEGTIELAFTEDAASPWKVAYLFRHDDKLYRWVLDGRPAPGAIVDEGIEATSTVTISGRFERPDGLTSAPDAEFDLPRLLPRSAEAVVCSLQWSFAWIPPSIRLFARAAEIPLVDLRGRSFSLARVFNVVLRRSLILTRDLRLPPRSNYSATELNREPPLENAENIPLHLFQLKNGDSGQRRRYRGTQRIFTGLTGGAGLEVSLANRGPSQMKDEGHELSISIRVSQGQFELPIEFVGAGIWEALVVSTLMSEAAGRVVVLDEPALNLHPTMQARLLARLRSEPGQFLLITHSPYLVPAQDEGDLRRVIRLDKRGDRSQVWRLDSSGSDLGLSKWAKELALSADARAMLFAAGIVLLEGDTELGALPVWFGKSEFAQRIESPVLLNTSFLSVGGDTQFATYVGLALQFGIPWVIVCDARFFAFYRESVRFSSNFLRQDLTIPSCRTSSTARGMSQAAPSKRW